MKRPRKVERAVREQRLWSTQELADYLSLPIQTIYQWRKRGYGPPGRRMGKHVRYRPAEVERWIDSLSERAA
jgi:excisionase family DNA binding protein